MLFSPLETHAHKMDSAMTIIDVAPNNNNIEITHRIFAHDLEHIFDLSDVGMNYFETENGQKMIQQYLERVFYIGTEQNPIKPRFIGIELAGDLIYVYFDANIHSADALIIDSNILEEFSGLQTNYVNLHIGENTKSLMFKNGQQAQVLQLR